MSNEWVKEFWGAAGRDDTTGALFQGHLAPAELAAHRVVELFRSDSRLSRAMKQISVVEAVGRWEEYRNYPRLLVYPSSVSEQDRPTLINSNECEIFIGILHWSKGIRDVRLWDPSVQSVTHYCKQILRENRQLPERVGAAAESATLARNSRPGAESFVQELTRDGYGMVAEFSWIYEFNVDQNTGLILNIAAAQ